VTTPIDEVIQQSFHVGNAAQAAQNPLAKTPLVGANLTHASAATDAAAASVGNIGTQVWRAPQNLTIVSAFWEPTGADQPAADAASYRTQSLRAGGADGTGTRVLASGTTLVSQASNTRRTLTVVDGNVVNAGEVVYGVNSATAGGTHAGTVVRAGHFSFNWKPL
jgi:hypothetical protein